MSKCKAELIQIAGSTYLTGRKLKPAFLAFIVARDWLLRPFLAVQPRPAPDLSKSGNIAVCVPDHLGDLLIAVPALKLLRTVAPEAKIALIVGEWTRVLATFLKDSGLVDDVIIYNMTILDRSNKSLLAKLQSELESRSIALPALQKKNLDLFFDMRGFSPNAWHIAISSRARYRIGFGLRGMAFVYHRLMDFDFAKPTGQLFLDAIGGLAGQTAIFRGPVLPGARLFAAKVVPEEVTRPYLVVQLYSAGVKKNLPDAFWREIFHILRGGRVIVLVGSKTEGQRAGESGLIMPGMISLFGKTTIPELLRVVEESDGVLGVDSFSSHIGLGYEKRVAVLTVEGFSDERAYPRGNPLLAFFPSETSSPREVADFVDK